MSNAGAGERTRENLKFYIDVLLTRAAPCHDHAQRMAYAAFALEAAVFTIVMFSARAQHSIAPMLILAVGAAAIVVCHLMLTAQLRRARAAAFLEAFAFALIRELILPAPIRGATKPDATSTARPSRSGPLAATAGGLASLLWGRLSQGQAEQDPRIPPSLRPLAPLARAKDAVADAAIPLTSLAMTAFLVARIALAWTDPSAWAAPPRHPARADRREPLTLSLQTPAPAPPSPAASPTPHPLAAIARPRHTAHGPASERPFEAPPPEARSYWSDGPRPGTWRSYTSEGWESYEDWGDGVPDTAR
jgi:hypothetical protein